MLMIALLALQATSSLPPDATRFSILAPVANAPCRPREPTGDDVVVCADPLPSQEIPYPAEIVGTAPRAINPHLTGVGALAAEGTPCAASQWGCQVSFGPPIAPLVAGAVGLLKDAFAKKPDRTGRVRIPLEERAK